MPYKIQQKHLKTQDNELFNFNRWTVDEYLNFFTLTEMKNYPYEWQDNTWVSINIEVDLDRIEYIRARYTILDLLA